jgi:hypothetical protein
MESSDNQKPEEPKVETRGRKPKPGAEPSAYLQKKREEEINQRFTDVNTKIDKLTDAFEKTAKLLEATIKVQDHKPAVPADAPARVELSDLFPTAWREIIDKELGIDFRADIIPSAGGDCVLRVYSPAHLDTRQGEDKKSGPYDIRCGLIHRASDLADVRTWVKKFVTNIRLTYPAFNPKQA